MRSIILVSILTAGAVQAQETRDWSPMAGVACFCTDRAGTRVEMGQTICLIVDDRAFVARYEMSLNNPMWRDTGTECVGAALAPPHGFGPVAGPRVV